MGMQGRRAAREHYALSRIVGTFTHFYQELIEEAAAKKAQRKMNGGIATIVDSPE
jgi:hypothetical protein